MTIAWATVEDEIQDWAERATGLTAIWSRQAGPRPSTTYIELSAVVRTIGQDWVDTSAAAVPSPGAECDSTVRGVRELTLTVQCFGGSHRGVTSSQAYLLEMITKARLPSQQLLFDAAGWTPATFDTLQDISGVIGGSVFEPRSRFVCRGFASSELVETSTYIEIVEVTNLINGNVFTIPEDASRPRLTESGAARWAGT